jgi:hypothetical protein
VSVTAPLERKTGVAETPVTLRIPKATATVTVKFKPAAGADADANNRRAASLRNADQTVAAHVAVDPQKPAAIKLPPGKYELVDYATAKANPAVGPIELRDGETREIEVDLSVRSSAPAATTSVQVVAWTADGVLITGAQPRLLDVEGKPIESTGTSGVGTTFTVAPGRYRAVLDRPGGGGPFTQDVDVAQAAEQAKIGRWEPIHLIVPDR